MISALVPTSPRLRRASESLKVEGQKSIPLSLRYAEQDLSFEFQMKAPHSFNRFPWDDFPLVWLHADELTVKKHPNYAAAKAGDLDSAVFLVKNLVSKAILGQLAQKFDHDEPILASAHAVERTGLNAIPQALADYLGEQLNWQVDSGIIQTNVVSHTGADGFSRMARQAEFSGTVEVSRNYLMVDDFVGQGGTLANLRGLLIENGGLVLGATALTGKPYSAILSPDCEILAQLRKKHGNELEHWWTERFGFGYECLTSSEARYLYRTPSFDRIRDRIAAAIEG